MRQKTYYGVTIGILMVDSTFRRFVGDIGNALTWPFPVQYKVVRGATPAEMVNLQGSDVLAPFKAAAEELIADGVDGIATTCGFLALYQRDMAEHCPVPVATSALLQVPMVERLIPAAKRVGVLTYSAEALTSAHLDAVGVDPSTPVVGMPRASEFYRWIMEGDASVPFDVLKAEVVETAQRLVRDHPATGAIVNECTNLTPFSADIAAATGLPVFDMVTMMHWFQAGLRPPSYTQ
ncbi:MAG: aspartate/glutamate racemase family protein [Pseudomonadota bacterium]